MDDRKQLKEAIEEYMGHRPLFTARLHKQILSNKKQPTGHYKKRLQMIFNSGVILAVLGAFIFFLLSEGAVPDVSHETSGALEKENLDLKAKLKLTETIAEKERIKHQEEMEEMNARIDKLIVEAPTDYGMMSEHLLTSIGFEGGVQAVQADLAKRTELIPYEGILGGTMMFGESSILVLSHEWVFAPISDGHIIGHLLLKYKIEDGKITKWEVVEAHLDGEELL